MTITRSLSSPPYRLPARQVRLARDSDPFDADILPLPRRPPRLPACIFVPRTRESDLYHFLRLVARPFQAVSIYVCTQGCPKPLDGENVCYKLRANPFRATIVNSFSHLTPFCTHRRSRHTVILSLGIITTCTLNSLLHDTPITPSSFQAISFLFSAQWRNSLN